MKNLISILSLLFILSCGEKSEHAQLQEKWSELFGKKPEKKSEIDFKNDSINPTVSNKNEAKTNQVKSGNQREDLVNFSKKYLRTRYSFACATPEEGFDCSGFITYVFNHFGYEVPRSSKDFEFFGKEISIENSKKGDLVLFTGTDEEIREIGHIGILINENGMNSDFIHSSSGKANGVTISSLGSEHYTQRFVKVISVIE